MSNERFFFTFGQSHIHPLGGYKMKDFWVEVKGRYDEAREKFTKRYGTKWSMQYYEKDFEAIKHYFPAGCHEVIE